MGLMIKPSGQTNRKVYQSLIFAPWFVAIVSVVAIQLQADITLPKYFADGMVLQRNSKIDLWGKANPDQELVVEFIDQRVEVKADHEGRWTAEVETPAAGGPHQIVVSAKKGNPRIILSDVMVGEVWLCSGQSNMEWPLNRSEDYQHAVESAKHYPNIRLFSVDRDSSSLPLEDFEKVQPWRVCSSDVVADFSAIAFYFGRELSDAIDHIPIGLIDVTWGGTVAEAWVSKPSLMAVDKLQPLVDYWDQRPNQENKQRPGHLFNAMIAPLTPVKIRGVIWYQGESNVGRGAQYATLFPTLIEDWRNNFANPEMPFLFAQLAPFRYQNRSPQELPEIWDAQLKTLMTVPHTGMVVTTDIGDLNDIHPSNKAEVGRRLAMIALNQVYQSEVVAEKRITVDSGPLFRFYQIEQDKIRIRFDNSGDGLVIHSDSSGLSHFEICGADREFKPARAVIEDDQVVVSSDQVSSPIAVRFAWSDTAEPNLFNSYNGAVHLPASPFRTDDFPLLSEDIGY